MSVYVFKSRKKVCCKNVPDMHLWGKISKKKIFLNKNFTVGPVFKGRSGNTKFILSGLNKNPCPM